MVRYFTSKTPGDYNHSNKHAVVNEDLEFFAFPYQPYVARKGWTSAHVANLSFSWSASIWHCLPNGKDEPITHQRFENKDAAFEWAYAQIKQREG